MPYNLELHFLQFINLTCISVFHGVSPYIFKQNKVYFAKGGMCIYVIFVFLLIACYQDYKHGKIRNWLIYAGFIWSIYQRWILYGPKGLIGLVEGILCVFIITYPLFKLGMLGAGDVKLFAVCAGSMGLKEGLIFLGCTFLAAAVLSLIKMLYHRNFLQRFRYFFNYVKQAVDTRCLTMYVYYSEKHPEIHICLAGPACLSMLLYLGGLY